MKMSTKQYWRLFHDCDHADILDTFDKVNWDKTDSWDAGIVIDFLRNEQIERAVAHMKGLLQK